MITRENTNNCTICDCGVVYTLHCDKCKSGSIKHHTPFKLPELAREVGFKTIPGKKASDSMLWVCPKCQGK